MDVMLDEEMRELEELVEVGYGTLKKRDLTGSIATVDTKDITTVQVGTFLSGLQGLASG
jgi:hypothetical protein